jgi:hypothetical protein
MPSTALRCVLCIRRRSSSIGSMHCSVRASALAGNVLGCRPRHDRRMAQRPRRPVPADLPSRLVAPALSPSPLKRSSLPMFDSGKQSYRTDIKLGERYRDDQTGIVGVATSITFFQHACERVQIEKVSDHDGDIKEYIFDAPRLTHVETNVTAKVAKTGGPGRPNAQRGPVRR